MISLRTIFGALPMMIELLTLTACSGGSDANGSSQADASTTCQTAGTLVVTNSGSSAYLIE
jgi:hypothetical protein